jgi:hypothetical protein
MHWDSLMMFGLFWVETFIFILCRCRQSYT